VDLSASGRVIVVGAGPTGLVLAAELALAGIDCVVLERRAGPRTDSRAICLHARSMESLDLRGQASVFAAAGLAVRSFPLGPRGSAIDFRRLNSDFPYLLDMPQSEMEQLMLARATALGVQVRWGTTVTAIGQDDTGVTVTTGAGQPTAGPPAAAAGGGAGPGTDLRASYVVGCDGVRSLVRDAVGLPFPGFANPGSVTLADLSLDRLPMTTTYGEMSKGGMLLVFPYRSGSCRVVMYDHARADAAPAEPVTLDEVAAGLRRITGRDLRPRDMYWSARYRSESRQATAYQAGRVLLAGDAAHAHSPAGAQGLNTGLQDAVNLGWKLAAQIRGRGPGWLLDSYHEERHPVGAAVLALTGRQFRLNTARTPARRVQRWVIQHLVVPLPLVQSRLARDYSGLSISYPPPPAPGPDGPARNAGHARPASDHAARPVSARPLTGQRLPRGTVTWTDGSAVRLYELFHDGEFVLLCREPATADGFTLPDGVRRVGYRHSSAALPPAVLVRPDGYIAWASDDRGPEANAAAAAHAAQFWAGPRDGQASPARSDASAD
jgi:2-polyprenyl-6-methoxyphenol hydroxylase-like FAD-dependent oxidoreductase